MKIEKRKKGGIERELTIGMITHPVVLAAISAKWDKEGLFKNPWSNIIGDWCVKYYEKYGKAPGKQIEGIFAAWSKRGKDEDTVDIIEKFLQAISGAYIKRRKEINPDYLIDQAKDYFTEVKVVRLEEAIKGCVSTGNLEEALKSIHKFDRVDIGAGATIDLLQDTESWKEALTDVEEEILIKYPGDLGKRFYRDALCRDGFIAFLGPEKRGKTMQLMDVAWMGMLQRKKVMFFEIGDMSKRQIMRRFGAKAAQQPFKACEYKYPLKLMLEGNKPIVKTKTRKINHGLSFTDAQKALQQVMLEQVKSKKPYFKLEVYANGTIGMAGIRASVQRQERLGWVPDIVVIDYADLLAPPPGYTESRDQINASWKAMRGLSQEYHCLVVTATQANAASYKSDSLDMNNFSEDKRKFAHVTGMVGLNQSEDDKEANVIRMNWLVLREDGYSTKRHCHVAGCPELASPCILSRM